MTRNTAANDKNTNTLNTLQTKPTNKGLLKRKSDPLSDTPKKQVRFSIDEDNDDDDSSNRDDFHINLFYETPITREYRLGTMVVYLKYL
jgi:hypothetical protein